MTPELIDALGHIVGPRWVRHRRAELATYTMDGLPTRESYPGVVVMPGSAAEVREIVRLLHLTGTPFVARGAGTGLSGGAVAEPDAVLVALTRMNRILKVDPVRRRATLHRVAGLSYSMKAAGSWARRHRSRSISGQSSTGRQSGVMRVWPWAFGSCGALVALPPAP